jgi:hypothetical protein
MKSQIFSVVTFMMAVAVVFFGNSGEANAVTITMKAP